MTEGAIDHTARAQIEAFIGESTRRWSEHMNVHHQDRKEATEHRKAVLDKIDTLHGRVNDVIRERGKIGIAIAGGLAEWLWRLVFAGGSAAVAVIATLKMFGP